jgi:hypothetical protein
MPFDGSLPEAGFFWLGSFWERYPEKRTIIDELVKTSRFTMKNMKGLQPYIIMATSCSSSPSL